VVVSGGTGSIYSYKTEMKDKFTIEGLKELVGEIPGAAYFGEQQSGYGVKEPDITDLGPKRVEDPDQMESKPDSGRAVINGYRAETEKKFAVIGGMTAGSIEAYIREKAEKIFGDYGMETEVTEAVITGSRSRGLEQSRSDLDIALEYRGEEPSEVVEAILNDEKLIIGGVKVDIRALNKDRDDPLEDFLRREEEKLEDAARKTRKRKSVSKDERPSVREKLRRGKSFMEKVKQQSLIKQTQLKQEQAK